MFLVTNENMGLCLYIHTLKILHSINLTNTFYDLFRLTFLSPNSHMNFICNIPYQIWGSILIQHWAMCVHHSYLYNNVTCTFLQYSELTIFQRIINLNIICCKYYFVVCLWRHLLFFIGSENMFKKNHFKTNSLFVTKSSFSLFFKYRP